MGGKINLGGGEMNLEKSSDADHFWKASRGRTKSVSKLGMKRGRIEQGHLKGLRIFNKT